MPSFTILRIFTLVLLSSLYGYAQAPQIEVSEKVWDFGFKDQGQKDRKVLKIHNKGDAPLEITSIDVTCGCVLPDLKERRIAPGTAVDFTLDLDAARGIGQIKKQVILSTNDPRHPKFEIEIAGHIRPVWWTSHQELQLWAVSNGVETERGFRITVNPDYKVNLTELTAHPSEIKVRSVPFKDPNGVYGWDVFLKFPKGMEAGYFEGIVIARSDFAPVPMIGLRVFGDIQGSVNATPENLAFGTLKPGESRTLGVRFTKEIGDGLSFAHGSLDNDRLKIAEVRELEPRKTIEVMITLTPRAGDKALVGKFALVIDQPGQKVFEIPWSARVAE